MYNLGLSFAIGLVLFGITAYFLGPIAGVIPGLGAMGVSMFLLARRVGKQVEAEMQQLVPLLQARRIQDAQAKIRSLQDRYGNWQFMLAAQLEAQLGMIEYMQMHWDKALPSLEKGQWRNWSALVCIACIHHRRGRKDEAWAFFDKAAQASSKEVIIYGIWATLLVKDGQRSKALEVISQGLKAQPDSAVLKELQGKVANKKKIKPKMFGDLWYQFFPEDMAQQMMMRGQRGGMPNAVQMPRPGARHAPRR